MSLGQVIAQARKKAQLSQKDLAARILKEDGTPISPQYLNDIERDRRSPIPDYLVRQFADQLKIPTNYLYYVNDSLPEEMRNIAAEPDKIEAAFKAFRREIKKH
jgi:transcriptional regulator with XRE-family HTH domain